MGPEAIQTYINPEEVVKRLAAAQGIDVLNLVKSMQEVQDQQQASQQAAAQQQYDLEMAKQTGAVMSSPMMDPTKNPALAEEGIPIEAQPMTEPPIE